MLWVGAVQDSLVTMSVVELGGVAMVFFLVLLVFAVGLIYFGQLYRSFPGWGPVAKFDHEADEDMRMRQHVLQHHTKTQQNRSYGATGKAPQESATNPFGASAQSGQLFGHVGVPGGAVDPQQLSHGQQIQLPNGQVATLLPDGRVALPDYQLPDGRMLPAGTLGVVRQDWEQCCREREEDALWAKDETEIRRKRNLGASDWHLYRTSDQPDLQRAADAGLYRNAATRQTYATIPQKLV